MMLVTACWFADIPEVFYHHGQEEEALSICGRSFSFSVYSSDLFFRPASTSCRTLPAKSQISSKSVDILTQLSDAQSEVAAVATPSVVNISTTRVIKSREEAPFDLFDDPFFRRFFGDQFPHPNVPKEHKEQSLGSGVIVSEDGYIVTNNHVIEKAQEIKVLLSNKKDYKAKLIGADPKTDIAVIKIDAKGLPALPWGDSNKLKVGEIVFAIGNPFGLNQTVTMGMISAVGRANVGIADYEDFIQTDAAINPGNSGGALINARGELIGINTAILSRTGGYQGIGFAVPSSMARQVMDSLVKYKKVVRGWLGVSIQEVTSDLAEEFGVKDLKGALVSGVMKGSPAEKAGIKQGDVILQFNGKIVEDTGHLRNMVSQTPVGSTVKVKPSSGRRKSLRWRWSLPSCRRKWPRRRPGKRSRAMTVKKKAPFSDGIDRP